MEIKSLLNFKEIFGLFSSEKKIAKIFLKIEFHLNVHIKSMNCDFYNICIVDKMLPQ